MIEFNFSVASEDVPGLPGLSKGDAVMIRSRDIIEGYEYDVWDVFGSGVVARVRTEHRSSLVPHTVKGATICKVNEMVRAIMDDMRAGD